MLVAVDCSIASNPSAACATEEFPLTSKTAPLECESIDPTVSCQSKYRRVQRGSGSHQLLQYWSSFPLPCRRHGPTFCQYRAACCALQPSSHSSPPPLDRSAAVLNQSSLCNTRTSTGSTANKLVLETRKWHKVKPITLVIFFKILHVHSLPPHHSSHCQRYRSLFIHNSQPQDSSA
jgi:hypothetical protein